MHLKIYNVSLFEKSNQYRDRAYDYEKKCIKQILRQQEKQNNKQQVGDNPPVPQINLSFYQYGIFFPHFLIKLNKVWGY